METPELSLRDAAFEGAHQSSFSAESFLSAAARLRKSFPKTSSEELHTALEAALALKNACYDFGDALRIGVLSREEALRQMENQHPGFSAKNYESALAYGLFISR